MTLYLALSLGVILSLVLAMTEGVRVNAIRTQIECVTDIAGNSALAEYNRQLLEQYDLFYIDTGYGTANPAYANTEAHIRNYMNRNFTLEGVNTLLPYTDATKLYAGEVVIQAAGIATDECGIGLKRQAILYEKDKVGLTLAENVMTNLETIAGYEEESAQLQEQRRKVDEQINESVNQKEASLPPERQTVETPNGPVEIEVKPKITRDNPADIVNATRGYSILQMVIKDTNAISYQQITPSNYVSGRALHVGSGCQPGITYPNSLFENIVFHEYILEKTGRYTQTLDKSLLKYQTEYILVGADSDEENLKSVVNRLLLFREVANALYLLSDGSKMGEIQVLSTTLSLVCLMPEIEPLVRYSILFAWAYAESVQDVRTLLSGGKVPLMKTSDTWKTGLLDMISFTTNFDDRTIGEGLSYEDYLRLFLCMTDENTVTMRLMDIIEMDIRQTAGNEHFRLDVCMEFFDVYCAVSSEYGYSYTIQRRYAYPLDG